MRITNSKERIISPPVRNETGAKWFSHNYLPVNNYGEYDDFKKENKANPEILNVLILSKVDCFYLFFAHIILVNLL